ncbi:MAG: DUF1579 domain-containing protein [Actinomycetota bacterium]|nr:DUF1579 domain-containing protein [Actinomycetota bacterium]
MTASAGLLQLVGGWSGTDRLWFEPNQLANEGDLAAVIRPTLGGRALIDEYRWTFGDDVHHGSMLIVPTDAGHEIALVDTFHTGGSIMRLTPPPDPDPDAVVDALGSYDADGQTWGWRVVVHQSDHDRVELTSWNISPDGEAARAVLTQLAREVDPAHDAVI